MSWTIDHELPLRHSRASDSADLEALAGALVHCDRVTCDAFMADVIRRTRLDLRHRCKLFTGRRADVARLRGELEGLRAARSFPQHVSEPEGAPHAVGSLRLTEQRQAE